LKAIEIFDALKKKIYSPVYFFYGEEPFYIDELTDFIEKNALDEPSREFNQTIVYGLDVTIPCWIILKIHWNLLFWLSTTNTKD